jgi:hypothetical protein
MTSGIRFIFSVLSAAAFVLTVPSTMLAQLSDLPLKPGLWETHVTTKAGGTNNTGTAQSCFTAGTTLGDYLTATNRGAPGAQCSTSNKAQSAKSVSYDTACGAQGMSSKGHIDVQLTSPDTLSGSSHTTVTGTMQGKPMNMAIDKTFDAKFLSSNCGDVKPLVVRGK